MNDTAQRVAEAGARMIEKGRGTISYFESLFLRNRCSSNELSASDMQDRSKQEDKDYSPELRNLTNLQENRPSSAKAAAEEYEGF